MKALIVSCFATALLGVFACSGSGVDAGPAVATVNGKGIPLTRLERRIGPNAELEKKKEIVEALVNEELVFQQAIKEGFLETSDRIRGELVRAYLQKKSSEVKSEATDDELQTHFEERRDKLERIRASHILIKVGEGTKEAARKKADEAFKKISEDPSKFAEIAREVSEDPSSKARGGDLFWFNRSQKTPEFAQAAFALKKVGDMSGVVETKDGFHIIRLTGSQRGFDYFKQSFRWEVEAKKRKEAIKAYYEKLRKSARVKIKEDVLNQASTPPKPKG